MFEYRTETYYKSDIMLSQEEVFDSKVLSLEVPRYVGQHLDKTYRNTVSLLQYCAQFAIAGEIRAWQTDKGTVLSYAYIEPQSDKAAVVDFRKGKELAGEDGREQEALEALSNAIDKYNRHAYAYKKRGEVNFILKKYHDSLRDFNKCLAIDDTIPDAYLGRANIAIHNKDYQEAITNLEFTLKKSIALQSIYWKARRMKAACHLELDQPELAAFDLKLYANKKFAPDNPNGKYTKQVKLQYLEVLADTEKWQDLFDFIATLDLEGEFADQEPDIIYFRALARHKLGKKGHLKDLKAAIKLGSERAEAYLKFIKS